MKIVYLPGLDGTGLLSEALAQALPPTLPAIIVSYPPDLALGYEALLRMVMEQLPTDEPYIILGESFSGPLAILASAARPPGLAGTILCVTFARNPLRFVPSWLRCLVWGPTQGLAPKRRLRQSILGRDADPEAWALIERARALVEPAVMAARVRAVLGVDVTAALRDIAVPVLYVQAAADELVRAHNLAPIQEHCPGLQVKVIDGPHYVTGTRASEVAAAVTAFAGAAT